MRDRQSTHVTALLEAVRRGESPAAAELLPLVYDELRRLAQREMAKERRGHTLQPTALVHEAYLRLVGGAEVRWEGRVHFFRAAAQAMRRILVDSARRRATQKHGGAARVPLSEAGDPADEPRPAELLALDESLDRLEERDPRKADVVKLRYFAGLSIDDTGAALGVTPRTVTRDWTAAKAWLFRDMTGNHEPPNEGLTTSGR